MLLFTRECPNLKIVFSGFLSKSILPNRALLLTKSPECRCCKRVRDGGVDGVVVAVIVTAGQQLQLEYLQHPDERIDDDVQDYNNDDNDGQVGQEGDHDDTWVPG